MYKPAYIATALFGASAVIIGAFGAHTLKTVFTPEQMASFETGVKYQFYHTMALGFTALMSVYFPGKFLRWASTCFIIGTLLFSGSIYLLNLLKLKGDIGIKGLGLITPIGGLFLIAAWILLLIQFNQKRFDKS